MKKELVLGCGHSKRKSLTSDGTFEYTNPTYLDIDPQVIPHIVHDLNAFPYPGKDNEYDEIHAYEVLEHTGQQGDWGFFFEQFNELYRILKPEGLLFITVPNYTSVWSVGDPGHTRIFSSAFVTFLDQNEYTKQVGKTSMTDYRFIYKGNFEPVFMKETKDVIAVILQKVQ